MANESLVTVTSEVTRLDRGVEERVGIGGCALRFQKVDVTLSWTAAGPAGLESPEGEIASACGEAVRRAMLGTQPVAGKVTPAPLREESDPV